MKPIIKYLHSPDIENLHDYRQEDGNSFCFLLQMIVGPENDKGEESFDIIVCSPKWLEENLEKDKIILGRHHLLSRYFDYNNFHKFLTDYIIKCESETWNECAEKLSRIGKWEFEDYKEK